MVECISTIFCLDVDGSLLVVVRLAVSRFAVDVRGWNWRDWQRPRWILSDHLSDVVVQPQVAGGRQWRCRQSGGHGCWRESRGVSRLLLLGQLLMLLMMLNEVTVVLTHLAVVVGDDGSKRRGWRARTADQTWWSRFGDCRTWLLRLSRIWKCVSQLLPEQFVAPVQHDVRLQVEPQIWIDVSAGNVT